MKSNGWTDRTAALQMFAHLEGEALNVALLMPEGERANWECLSQGLSDYYNSPGRLAVFRRQFESATRQPEMDPATFATELDILAERGFGDMGRYRGAAACVDISMVFLRILPSETLWIAVACGRAIRNRRSQVRVLTWTRTLWKGQVSLGYTGVSERGQRSGR